MSGRVGAILVAAGAARRMGFDKTWAPLGGRPVIWYGLRTLLASPEIAELAVVVAEHRLDVARDLLGELGVRASVCPGGARRRDSVAAGLALLQSCDWIVVHDAARPLAEPRLIEAGLETARQTGAAVAAVPVRDTIKRVTGRTVVETLPRDKLWRVQTPQVFVRPLLERALAASHDDVTDEAALVERLGVDVRIFEGAEHNQKLTTPDDFALAELWLARLGAAGTAETAVR